MMTRLEAIERIERIRHDYYEEKEEDCLALTMAILDMHDAMFREGRKKDEEGNHQR